MSAVFFHAPLLQFTGSSLTGGKEQPKRLDDEDTISKQNKKRPRPILLQHMSPLLKVNSPFRFKASGYVPVYVFGKSSTEDNNNSEDLQ